MSAPGSTGSAGASQQCDIRSMRRYYRDMHPLEHGRVQVGTTDAFAPDSGARGSRVTHGAGQATYQTALVLQQQLCEVAASVLGGPTTAVTLDNGACVVHSAPTQRLTFAEIAAAAGQRPLRAQTLYRVSRSPT